MLTYEFDHDEKGGYFQVSELDKQAGKMTFVWDGEGKLIIDHTIVMEGFNGKGIGKALVLYGARFAEENGLKIKPVCPYAHKVLYADASFSTILYE